MKEHSYSVVFVCLGNICRSPLAEGILRHLAHVHGLGDMLRVESRGIGGWHRGEKAHANTRRVAGTRGISLESHRARQFSAEDFKRFDLIVAMDAENFEFLAQVHGAALSKLRRLRDFDPGAESLDVPDPYGNDIHYFGRVHDIIERSCTQLFQEIRAELSGTIDS